MSDLLQEITRRIADPGAFLKRNTISEDRYEPVTLWGARAVEALFNETIENLNTALCLKAQEADGFSEVALRATNERDTWKRRYEEKEKPVRVLEKELAAAREAVQAAGRIALEEQRKAGNLSAELQRLKQAAEGVCGYLIPIAQDTHVAFESPLPIENLRALEAVLKPGKPAVDFYNATVGDGTIECTCAQCGKRFKRVAGCVNLCDNCTPL